jgi:hypothetical protein
MRWIFMLLLAAPAWACSCISWPTAGEAWADSRLVFVGSVERTTLDPGGPLQLVGVRVEEAFKGVKRGDEVTLRQPMHSCSPGFKAGDRVLFYLHPADQENTWVANGCHRSRGLAEAADDLLLLRALPESLKRTRLSGEINLYERSIAEGFRRQRALVGVRVTIAGEQRSIEAVTNADGVFEVFGLPAGGYRVSADVPAKMKLLFASAIGRQSRGGREGVVNLPANGSAGVSFVMMVDNRMSGRMLDPGGKPMKGACVNLEPATGKAGQQFYVADCSDEDGKFELDEMPGGLYRLVVNRSGRQTASSPFPTLYYPGVADKEKATVVTIGDGQHLEGLDIRAPAVSRRIRISGRIQFRDGTPVPEGRVNFASADGAYREYAKAKDDGTFELTVVAGFAGEVSGEIWVDRDTAAKCPDFQAKLNPGGYIAILHPTPVATLGVADQLNVLLTFPFASCRWWSAR